VRFLIDNQLPSALASYLRRQGYDCEHVLEVGLAGSSDTALCEYAAANERVIISKDEDFLYLSSRPNANFQLVWVRLGNCRTPELLKAFESAWHQVERALNAGEKVVEVR
jgi:predicted nuclease of predicted toxin-antitoxin system